MQPSGQFETQKAGHRELVCTATIEGPEGSCPEHDFDADGLHDGRHGWLLAGTGALGLLMVICGVTGILTHRSSLGGGGAKLRMALMTSDFGTKMEPLGNRDPEQLKEMTRGDLAALRRQEELKTVKLHGAPPSDEGVTRLPVKVTWPLEAHKETPGDQDGVFRMVQHTDGFSSLRTAGGAWVTVGSNGVARAVGGVLADGNQTATPVEDSQRFRLLLSSDGAASLRHSSGRCLSAAGPGQVRLGSCSDDGAAFNLQFVEELRSDEVEVLSQGVTTEESGDDEEEEQGVKQESGSEEEEKSIFSGGRGGETSIFSSDQSLKQALDMEGKTGRRLADRTLQVTLEGSGEEAKVGRKMKMKSKSGFYLSMKKVWVQDYQVDLVAVNDSASGQAVDCTRFWAMEPVQGKISFRTLRASFISLGPMGRFTASSTEEIFQKVDHGDGMISLKTSDGRYWSSLPRGGVITGPTAQLWEKFRLVNHEDGSVSLRNFNDFPLCAVERTVSLFTCETRNDNEAYFMQGSNPSVTVTNLGYMQQWYGYKTKVDLYYQYVKERAEADVPGELIILADNGDMAFGGCSYEDLLTKYDKIVRASDFAQVVAGADNKLFPPGDWNYTVFDTRRHKVMEAFGLNMSAYCAISDCTTYSYTYANSGFLMGPPKELSWLLACMLEHGNVEDTDTGFDDQQGLHACMFAHPSLVTLDYAGTLTLELIYFKKLALTSSGGKVFNEVVNHSPQCFVHGNGDTLGDLWDDLFDGFTETENWGEDFEH